MISRLVATARFVGLALTTAILAVSGIYIIVYLARWEWNRAIVCALIFVSALVIVSTVLVMRSMRRIEERLDGIEQAGTSEVRAALQITNAEAAAARHFDWLRRPNSTGVFVPVLLGTGAVLSVVAYAIERIAGLAAGASLDRRTATILPLDLPLSSRGAVRVTGPPRGPVRSHRGPATLAAVLTVALLSGLGVEAIRRITQTRMNELSRPGTTTLTIEITTKDPTLAPTAAAAALWVACRDRVPGSPTLTQATAHADRVVLRIDQALGRTGRLRIIGCLEDFTIERMMADVTSIVVADEGRPDAK